jgi:hypothetical protein
MTSLYQLATDFRNQLDELFDENGEATPAFEEFRVQLGSKINQVAAYVLNVESDVDQCKEVIDRIQARKKSYERKAQRLRDYLAENMKVAGITEIKADDRSFVIKLYPERDESVQIDDGIAFPIELCNIKPPEPSKLKIKAAILAGEPIIGARIITKDRLVIK